MGQLEIFVLIVKKAIAQIRDIFRDKFGIFHWPSTNLKGCSLKTSTETNEIATALAKAQKLIEGAKKDSANPFFKSKYADLASVIEAIREPFALNGLSYIQSTRITEQGNIVLVTRISHTSGQFYEGEWPIKAEKDGVQAQGSAFTYARRYALSALCGVAQIDDDGEIAMHRPNVTATSMQNMKPPTGKPY